MKLCELKCDYRCSYTAIKYIRLLSTKIGHKKIKQKNCSTNSFFLQKNHHHNNIKYIFTAILASLVEKKTRDSWIDVWTEMYKSLIFICIKLKFPQNEKTQANWMCARDITQSVWLWTKRNHQYQDGNPINIHNILNITCQTSWTSRDWEAIAIDRKNENIKIIVIWKKIRKQDNECNLCDGTAIHRHHHHHHFTEMRKIVMPKNEATDTDIRLFNLVALIKKRSQKTPELFIFLTDWSEVQLTLSYSHPCLQFCSFFFRSQIFFFLISIPCVFDANNEGWLQRANFQF